MDAPDCARPPLGESELSGQQIGTAVGFVAGFFLPGGPQVWAGIGGMVGGAIDPTKVQGPRLSDGMTVTALDGIPNPWGFGTFAVGANVLNSFDLVEHKHTDDGKGSGVEQETFTYTRSYALGICRGKRNSDGTYEPIAGILRATHNGKVVYNTQPDASGEQLANNTKFLENHQFYLGGDEQLPDPTLESYLGAGNASAYVGEVYMVATDEDQTESRGAIGTWEFVVAMDGDVEPLETDFYPGRLSRFQNGTWPLADQESDYVLTGFLDGIGDTQYQGASIADIISHFTTGGRNPSVYLGWANTNTSTPVPGIGLDLEAVGVSNFVEQADNTNSSAVVLVYNDMTPDEYRDYAPVVDACEWVDGDLSLQDRRGNVSMRFDTDPGPPWGLVDVCDGIDSVYGKFPLCILAERKRVEPLPGGGAGGRSIPDAPGWWLLPDGTVSPLGDFESVAGDFRVLSVASSIVDNEYSYYETGPAIHEDDPRYDDQAFWEDVYSNASGLPGGWVYGVDYPVQVSSAYKPTVESEFVITDSVALGVIVAEVCRRSGLDDEDFDVSELSDLVGGFKVAVEATGESVISSLMPAFFFDCGEWDDKLRFVKRGGDAVFALTVDDLAERDGPVIEETEAQEVELLRKVMVRAMDPAAGYVETTQSAERRSSTVAAKGEQTLALPVVMDKDTQARVADKRIKVAWSEIRKFKWALPYTRPELTPTDVGTITDRQGRTQRIQLMEMTDDSGLIQIEEAKLTRQSAYTSDVEGIVHNPPTNTSPGLIGPTYGVVMNLPSLRTQDNVPGVYLAACGYLPGWRAAAVLMSPDGSESFSTVATISQPSRMGVLTSDVGAAEEPIEVFMNSGEISSITDTQLAARGNAWAITSNFGTPDAASEVGQSKTATLDSGGGYDLTDNVRGGLGTEAAVHESGDPFVMLSSVYFLPLDISLAGQTLIFKFVSYGTSPDDAEEIEFVFNPIFTSVTVAQLTDGGIPITVNGNPIYVVNSNA